MAKSLQRIEAVQMRRGGKSIREISKKLGVSKSTVSIWCQDVVLTKEQIETLRKRMQVGSYAGRMKGASINKQRRLDRIAFWETDAVKTIKEVSKRDLMFAGIGLYLGEGSKKQRRFRFTNSDPQLIKACIAWLSLFGVNTSQLYCHIFINEMHKARISDITKKWAAVTNIPLGNFKNPVFIKSKLKKIYANHDTYLGVLTLSVYSSSELFYRILGLMKSFLYYVNDQKPA